MDKYFDIIEKHRNMINRLLIYRCDRDDNFQARVISLMQTALFFCTISIVISARD